MKTLTLPIGGILLIIILCCLPIHAQTFEEVEFTDCSKLSVPVNHIADEKLTAKTITSFNVLKKQAVFIYESENKAGFSILPGKLTKKIIAKNQNLFNKIDKINTSYSLSQNGTSFSIDGFDSVESPSPSLCGSCRVTANIVLLEIKLGDSVYYIPFVESLKHLKESSSEKIPTDSN